MGFTPEQAEMLDAKLDPRYVSQREGKFDYIEGHHAIREANRIFGFGNWQRHTLANDCIMAEPYRNDKGREGVRVAYLARVEVVVRTADGHWISYEGTGYGDSTNYNDNSHAGEAHESASKEAETDAMKRAMICLGDQFGLALYDANREHVEGGTPAPARQQRRSSPPPSAEGAPACPKCGKEMRKRSGKKGDFWGCTGYPDCRGTIDVGDEHNSPAPTPAPNPLPKEDDEEDPFGDDAPTGNVSRLDEPEVTDSPSLTAAVLALGLTPMAAVREVNAAAQSLWGTGMADIDNASMKPEHWRELYHEVKRTKEAAA